jgi:hypothetical protein
MTTYSPKGEIQPGWVYFQVKATSRLPLLEDHSREGFNQHEKVIFCLPASRWRINADTVPFQGETAGGHRGEARTAG